MIKKLSILFLLFTTSAFAQVNVSVDTLPDAKSTDSVAVLNNDLRLNQNAINAIGGYFLPNGALSPSAGGTGDVKTVHTTGSLYYDDGTDFFQNVGIGTSNASGGYFLKNNGASAPTYNLAIANQSGKSGSVLTTDGSSPSGVTSWVGGLTLVSSTSISGAATTGSISITSGQTYLVIFNFSNLSGADTLQLEFNNISTGTTYKYVNTGNTTTGVIANSSAGASIGFIGRAVASASTKGIQGSFYIQQVGASSQVYRAWGQTVLDDNATSLNATMTFLITWTNSVNVTDFELLTNGGSTMTGTVQVYKLSIS